MAKAKGKPAARRSTEELLAEARRLNARAAELTKQMQELEARIARSRVETPEDRPKADKGRTP